MKKIIYTLLLLLVSTVCTLSTASAQTTLQGKVTDASSSEAILFATVALYKNDVLMTGTETDLDGLYFFADMDAGTYSIEVSYVGYQTQRLTDVIVNQGRTNTLDIKLSVGTVLDEVCILAYKAPLIATDNTTSGGTVTAEKIRTLPLKNVDAIAATSAGVAQTSDGLAIRGSRPNATVYYIDGIRVSGSHNLTPHKANGRVITEEPPADYNTESYGHIVENKANNPFVSPLSTFGVDVDRASYSNVRRMINDGELPPADAVRVEELINYFNYEYAAPSSKHPFAVHTELAYCPWDREKQVLRIGLQGEKIDFEDLPPSNIVFLIDVSGSMSSRNKLPLVKASFEMLLDQLREQDRVAIVTYAGHAGVALPSTPASKREEILGVLEDLQSGGSTAGADGINTAYEIALENYMPDGNNRVVLATDGDFNVGVSSNGGLEDLIASKREQGIFLSVLGYGMGNYKDDKLQLLADKGNGNHAYIDTKAEAEKVLVKEFGGTMHTIAKDVKIQIEFNPAYVSRYRLIGYENRLLNPEDFKDDTKDAGEIGSGHSVTALYEITPNTDYATDVNDKLLYQQKAANLIYNGELGQIKLRYKTPQGSKSKLLKEKIYAIPNTDSQLSTATRHAMAVAEYGLVVRDSAYKVDASLENVRSRLEEAGPTAYAEFLELVEDTIDITNVE